VQIYEVGEHEGRPFFSLEFVPGGSLADKLRGVPQPPPAAAPLVETLAQAIHVAHQHGIVHRDLKPANVLLAADGTPRISDFGLAKQLGTGPGQTQTGAILGTPSYMAPEQAGGRSRTLGPAADIYALGALLYEMLTGRPPFMGETALDTMQQVLNQEPVPPRQLQPKVPRDLETICLKCLSKEPARRYASALDLAEDLRRFRSGEPIQARPLGTLGRLARWSYRHPAVALLTALLILALAGGLAGVSWKWHEAEQQKILARQAEERALAWARAEAEARGQAEQAQKDTARALKYLTASAVAATFGQLPTDGQTLLARVGKRPEVIRSLQHACALGEQLQSDRPHGYLLLSLAEQYAELSVFQAAAGQRLEATQSGLRGLDYLNRLPWADRVAIGDHKDLGTTCFLLGAVLMNLDRLEEAGQAFQQAIRHQKAVLEESPPNRNLRKVVSVSYFHLAHVQRESGRLAESAATALERQKLWRDDADEVYDVACELARCASKVAPGKADQALTPPQRQERLRYEDQAMNVLRQAVALGLKDAAAVQGDPDLKLLHPRPDFQKLVAELAKKERRN
jgi:serine/threonine-protein kinase